MRNENERLSYNLKALSSSLLSCDEWSTFFYFFLVVFRWIVIAKSRIINERERERKIGQNWCKQNGDGAKGNLFILQFFYLKKKGNFLDFFSFKNGAVEDKIQVIVRSPRHVQSSLFSLHLVSIAKRIINPTKSSLPKFPLFSQKLWQNPRYYYSIFSHSSLHFNQTWHLPHRR